jgi:hypothetical protein
VAVLDTGVDPDHPTLKDRVADFAEFNDQGQQVKSGLAAA